MKRLLTTLHTIGLICACLSVPFAILIALRYQPAPLVRASVTNAELVSVILTGLTIVLGVVAVVIAGLAIWGYHAIRDEAKAIANRTARVETRKRVIEYLRSPGGIEIVENEVAKRLEEMRAADQIATSFSKESLKPDTLETENEPKVGQPFRKGKGA